MEFIPTQIYFLQRWNRHTSLSDVYEVSSHPDDPAPISPAMLPTLEEDPHSPPVEQFTCDDLKDYGMARWRRVQYLLDQCFVKWRRNYLHTLQSRHEWKIAKPCVKFGNLVLVRDKVLKRNSWPTGRVAKVNVSSDGLVRSAFVDMIKTGCVKQRYERAITDLVLLVTSLSHSCDAY